MNYLSLYLVTLVCFVGKLMIKINHVDVLEKYVKIAVKKKSLERWTIQNNYK